jgi:hypothetical protein
MISCLFDHIGLLDATTSKSGIYINRLQGISTQQMNDIRDDETYSIEDAWDDIQNRAIDQMEQRVQTSAAKYYNNYSYIANVVTSQYNVNTAVAQSTNYVGWLFDGSASDYKNMKLIIPSINLYTTNSVSSNITIFNAVTGDTLDTIPFSGVAGQINNIPINKEYQLHKYTKIFVAYDDSEVQTIIASDLSGQNTINFSSKKIAKTATVISGNMSSVGSEGQGLIMNYSISCSLDNFICQRLTLFTNPYLYLLGYEFCQERMFSDRINHWTLMNREEASELSVVFLDRFNEQIDSTLKALKVTDYDYCFECSREINYRTLLP